MGLTGRKCEECKGAGCSSCGGTGDERVNDHSKIPWRQGKTRDGYTGSWIVSDNEPIRDMSEDSMRFYGAMLVAESLGRADAIRIISCVNAMEGISSEMLADATTAEPHDIKCRLLYILSRI
jgi:hypothetical protein